MSGRPDDSDDGPATPDVWSMVSLLVAGPVAWAGIGWGADELLDTSVFLPIGVVVGFIGSFYLVYQRYGRD